MKKVVITLVVLAVAAGANAALKISVNGVIDPPDTVVFTRPSDILIIDIWGDGQTPLGTFFLGINLAGGEYGSIDISAVTIPYPGNTKSIGWLDDPDVCVLLGVKCPVLVIEFVDLVAAPDIPKPLLGTLVDNIKFHNDGTFSDITLSLFDENGILLDAQVIHIPEPITIALLGLGGLLVRRR
jgi:hypothetical protein